VAHFFIKRPVFAIVVSIVIVLLGMVTYIRLPVAQYPQIALPTVQVRAVYPGADGKTVADTVATQIEQQVNGVPGLIYMKSSSANSGDYNLICTFALGTNVDIAAVNVQNRVSQAIPLLPLSVQEQGVSVQQQSTEILMMITVYSPTDSYDALFLTNYAQINMINPLGRVSGVGSTNLYGAGQYAMRMWLRPDKMAKLHLQYSDIKAALQTQNVPAPAGQVGQPPAAKNIQFQYNITAKGQLESKKEFENIEIRTNPDGSILRMKDVGRVELGGNAYTTFGRINGKPAGVIFIYTAPGANAIKTAEGVRATLADLAKAMPPGMTYAVNVDNTVFVKEALHDVEKTLFEAIGLVLIVVLLFLGNLRATFIPMLAVPVSLIGTFIAFGPLGFSINTLTLFGLVLAIGLVVDDAIVVVEAAEHHIEKGKTPLEATEQAMTEVSGPVVAIALVLISVFVPLAFIPGIIGQLYQQFALTLAVSVGISAFVALSLTPALCAMILRPRRQSNDIFARFFAGFNKYFDRIRHGYTSLVAICIRRTIFMLIALAVITAGALGLQKFLPTGFVPYEDQGYFYGQVILPDGASLERTDAFARKVEDYFGHLHGVKDVLTVGGYNVVQSNITSNAALIVPVLEPWDERTKRDLQMVPLLRQMQAKLKSFPEAVGLIFPPPPLPGFSGQSITFELEAKQGQTPAELAGVANQLMAAASKRKELANLYNTTGVLNPQIKLDIDRDKVAEFGVTPSDVFSNMQAYLGGIKVNDFVLFNQSWEVMVQAEPDYRATPASIKQIYIRSKNDQMVPVSSMATVRRVTGPDLVQRYNVQLSTEIQAANAPGFSTGQAQRAMEEVAKESLPPGYGYEWSALSLQEKQAGGTQGMIFAFALLLVFLVLAAQYENWGIPISIMLGMPIGMLAALLSTALRTVINDVYVQIGLIMIVGLAAKNAVLIVEFAKEAYEKEGMPVVDAAIKGADLRFRPILMTSLAFIIGTIPLVFASGAGANSRQSLGSAVSGGMTITTALGVLFIPVLYVLIVRLEERLSGRHKKRPPKHEMLVPPEPRPEPAGSAGD